MKILTGGCRIYSGDDGRVSTLGNWTARTVISHDSGARHITQSINDYAPGSSPAVVNPNAEEVLYVASGQGKCRVNGFEYELSPGVGDFYSAGRGLQHREHQLGDNPYCQLMLPRGSAAAHRR